MNNQQQLAERLLLFHGVSQTLNFGQAAIRLGVSKSHLSQQIKALEGQLSCQLFYRTTRLVTLTEAGKKLQSSSLAMQQLIDNVQNISADLHEKVSGTLRISVPISLGLAWFTDITYQFTALYPEIALQCRLNNHRINLVKEECDIAIRISDSLPDFVIAKKIGVMQEGIYASPEYFKSHAGIVKPEDLIDHRCFLHTNLLSQKEWVFKKNNQALSIAPIKSSLSFDIHQPLLTLAEQGKGVTRLPKYVAQQSVKKGDVIPLLADYHLPTTDIHALYLPQTNVPEKIKVFISFIKKIFKQQNMV
ncbi:LysR family transcriptional regulator [Psychromonas hadalis]|uniref:LysR family transcriptional regulator n=1 Tax=Psychromonas hadalis TaxID=211669 RepID=UPI0003B3FD9E|nr:LysR family transcriptional regulator [Psychromonas hadalis]